MQLDISTKVPSLVVTFLILLGKLYDNKIKYILFLEPIRLSWITNMYETEAAKYFCISQYDEKRICTLKFVNILFSLPTIWDMHSSVKLYAMGQEPEFSDRSI